MADEDPEQLKEILSVVSTEIPKLIESITKTIYNMDNAENMAKAVAQFYKSMKEAGMDDKQAYELTQEFMSSFSIGGIIGQAVQGGSSRENRDDLNEYIEERIGKKLEKKLEKLKDDE
jgi:hypothetical protein